MTFFEVLFTKKQLTKRRDSKIQGEEIPASIYLFKGSNRNTRTRCGICSICQGCHSSVFIVNFEHISHLALVFLLLTLSKKLPAGIDIIMINGCITPKKSRSTINFIRDMHKKKVIVEVMKTNYIFKPRSVLEE